MSEYNGYNLVAEFHLKFGHLIYQRHGVVPWAVRLLRSRLILEELGELAIAIHEKQQVLIADAVTDLLYVTIGTAVSCTGPVPDCWAVCSNVQRDYLESLGDVTRMVERVITSLAKDQAEQQVKQGLISLMLVLSYGFKLPLEALFREVHKANMTKMVVDTAGGKKGSIKGPGYQAPDLERILACTST